MSALQIPGSPSRRAAMLVAGLLSVWAEASSVTVEHLLLAASGDGEIADRLGDAAIDVLRNMTKADACAERMAEQLDEDQEKVLQEKLRLLVLSETLRRALAHAEPSLRLRGSLRELVEASLRYAAPEVVQAVAANARGASISSDPGAYRVPAGVGPYAVRIHDDKTTPMKLVISALMGDLGMPTWEAYLATYTTHVGGFADCGRYELEEAKTRAACVEKTARDAGHALRVSVEKRGGPRVSLDPELLAATGEGALLGGSIIVAKPGFRRKLGIIGGLALIVAVAASLIGARRFSDDDLNKGRMDKDQRLVDPETGRRR